VPQVVGGTVADWGSIPDVGGFGASSVRAVRLPYCGGNPPAMTVGGGIRQWGRSAELLPSLSCLCYIDGVLLVVAYDIAVVLQVGETSCWLGLTVPKRQAAWAEQVDLGWHVVTPKCCGHVDAAVAI
jgi:hypothetical protein